MLPNSSQPNQFPVPQLSLLDMLFDRMPMGIAILDENLTLLRCNPTWANFIERYTPTPASKVVPGVRFLDIAPGTERTSVKRYETALAGKTVREEAVPMESGGMLSYWDVVITPLLREGKVVGVLDVTAPATERKLALDELREHRDQLEKTVLSRTTALTQANRRLREQIAERIRAEEDLLEERNFIAAVLDTVGALVVVLDHEGRIVRFNRACEHLSGYTFAEVRGRKVWDLFLVPEEVELVKGFLHDLLAGAAPRRAENHWLTKTGEKRLIDWSNTTLVDGEGLPKYVVATGIDITERRRAEEALRESEEKYRHLVEDANSIILRMDTEGRITFFNEFAERFFGYAESDIIGRNVIGTIVPPTDAAGRDLRQLVRDIGARPERYAANENENMLASGERVWISWTNRAVTDALGRTKEILCVGNDVTERRQAVEALQRAHAELESRVAQRTAELSRSNAALQEQIAERRRVERELRERSAFENLVTTISTHFINLSESDVDEGINNALRAIGEFAGVDRSYVFLVSDDGTVMNNTHEWCAPGIEPQIERLQGLPSAILPWWTEKVRRLETIHIPRVADMPDAARAERELLQAQQIVSLVVLPLVYGGQAVGFLGFDAVREEKSWSAESVKLLRIVGEIFVNAIERKKAVDALQQAYQMMEQRVQDRTRELYSLLAVQQAISSRVDPEAMLQMIADEARALTSSELAVLYILEGDHLRIAVTSGTIDPSFRDVQVPVEGSLAGLAIKTGKPQSTVDAPRDERTYLPTVNRAGAKSLMVVPLIYGTRKIGVIAMANKSDGCYGPEDERRLMMLASGAAIDLENARLYHEEQERRQEADQRRRVAEGLRDILAILNSNRPLAEILDYIVAQACRLMGTDTGALYRLQPDGKALVIQSALGLPSEYVSEVSIPVGQGAVGKAVVTREPVAVFDMVAAFGKGSLMRDPKRKAQLERLAARYRAMLAVPLVVKDEVYGGIVLYYPQPREFTSEEVGLAATFGDQAALAIENARLKAQAEQSAVAAERSRLARDLHDAVTQTLFSASLIAEVLPRLWERSPEEGRRRLEELRQLTRGALAEMRTLLLELRPAALTEAPLGDLLRQLAEATTGRARLPVDVVIEGQRVLPPDVQIALYRIAQEALNNVAKHASAARAAVSLRCEPSEVELLVTDDGKGFDATLVSPDHLGLGIMRERAEAVGAVLQISSRQGEGTQVKALWRTPAAAEAAK